MLSLRARLLAGLLVLAGAGLLVLAAVTYTEQRSFLNSRLDGEVRAADPAIDNALGRGEALDEDDERAAPGAAGGAPTSAGTGPGSPGVTSSRGDGGESRSRAPGPRPGMPTPDLPLGTFGEVREASGKTISHQFSYGESIPEPRIPAHVPIGRLFTVDAKGSNEFQYRAFATAHPSGAITIVAIPTREVQQTLSHLLLVEGLVIAGVLLLLAAGASWALRLGLRPLDRMAKTASGIAAGDLSRRVPASERTEVGRLGIALNEMLGRLEQAFAERTASEERLRRFLADASHELRTPLASIRGYAELFRMGAARDAHEVELAMRRIEEESSRMGKLVEDLLALARLDQTPAPTRVQLDLAALAADAVADARAIAPEREITLGGQGETLVAGDRDQLHQVLANLLRNALVHTPPGSPVEVSIARGGDGWVRLAVRDHGPGLPAGADDVFERFWRSERGRERGKAGAGLGLAITRAIVLAHGGSIRAAQAEGGGALFELRLPAARAPSEHGSPSQPAAGAAREPAQPAARGS